MSETAASPEPEDPSANVGAIRVFGNPAYLFLIVAGSIFIAEVLVMAILGFLPPLASHARALLDGALLSVTICPVLYFFAFRPLGVSIRRSRRAEAEKDALIRELRSALAEVDTLQGIIPICASCKKIRDDEGFWHQVEAYMAAHSKALFTHGICPECMKRLYPKYRGRRGSEESHLPGGG